MNDRLQELVAKYSHEAQTNKSVRRREAYQQAHDELQRVLDGNQTLWNVRALYYDFAMFEHNTTKLSVVHLVRADLNEITNNST
jgi:hypothetical protein